MRDLSGGFHDVGTLVKYCTLVVSISCEVDAGEERTNERTNGTTDQLGVNPEETTNTRY